VGVGVGIGDKGDGDGDEDANGDADSCDLVHHVEKDYSQKTWRESKVGEEEGEDRACKLL
jgi:hypothetical protein